MCRTEHHLNKNIKRKIALFCNVEEKAVIESIDVDSIYEVPIKMLNEGLDKVVLKKLNLKCSDKIDLDNCHRFLKKLKKPKKEIRLGLIGKYIELKDSYKSISEAFIHAGTSHNCKVNLEWIHAEDLNAKNVKKELSNLDGVLVAPGFGDRGVEGKIAAINHVRENKIPLFVLECNVQ